MDLRITDEVTGIDPNVYVISNFDFTQKEYHPFIATTRWDNVLVDIDSKATPAGIIGQLVGSAIITPTINKEDVTPKVLKILGEIYPDSRARLRQAYVKGKEEFLSLIKQLGVNII